MLSDVESDPELDSRLVLEAESSQLKEMNDHLKQENMHLKAQFTQAMRLAGEVEKVTARSQHLSEKLTRSKNEKQELLGRIERLTRASESLEGDLARERQDGLDARKLEARGYEREVAKAKTSAKRQNDRMAERLKKLETAKDASDRKCRKLEVDLERLVKSAERRFEMEFATVQQLVGFLNEPPHIVVPMDMSAVNIDHEKRRAQRAKSRLTQSLNENEELRSEIELLKRESAMMSHTVETPKLDKSPKRRVVFDNRSEDFREMEHARQVRGLEAEVRKLKEELVDKEKDKVESPFGLQEPQPIVRVVRNAEEIEEYESQIAELTRQVSTIEEKCTDLHRRMKKSEGEKDMLEQKNERLVRECDVLKKRCQTRDGELDELNGKVVVLERVSSEHNDGKRKVSSLKKRVVDLEAAIHARDQEVRDLTNAKEEQEREISQQTFAVTQLKRDLEQKTAKMNEVRHERDEGRRELLRRKDVADVLPPSAFKCSVFDGNLALEIDRVAGADVVQAETRIQSIYRLIHKHYTDKVTVSDRALREVREACKSSEDALGQFLSSVTTLLSIKPVSVDEFVVKFESVLEAIEALKAQADASRRSSDLMAGVLRHLQETFGLEITRDVSKGLTQINELHALLDRQARRIAKASKQSQQMTKESQAMKNTLEAQITEISNDNVNLAKELDIAMQTVGELTSAVERQKRRVRSLKTELGENQRVHDEMEERMKYQRQGMLDEKSKLENDLRERIRTVDEQRNQSDLALHGSQEITENLRKKIRQQKIKLAQCRMAATKEKDEVASRERSLSSQWNSEKHALVDKHQKTVSKLKERCDIQQKEVESLTERLQGSSTMSTRVKEQLSRLRFENERLMQEIAAKTERAEREKRIAEDAAKVQVLSAQSDFTAKLDEQYAQLEREKRVLFGHASDQLRQFFNPQDEINEDSFKSILARARSELARLSASDHAVRQLVGAVANQKTEDAVAEVFLCGES